MAYYPIAPLCCCCCLVSCFQAPFRPRSPRRPTLRPVLFPQNQRPFSDAFHDQVHVLFTVYSKCFR
jgi:hypothetical protein